MKRDSTSIKKAQSLNLRDIAVIVFRQKWPITLTFLTTATAAAIMAYAMSDQYE